MRTIVDIPESVLAVLNSERQERGCSRAALIREALEAYTGALAVQDSQAAYGIWKDKKTDALSYQSRLRNEWKQE